MSATGGFGPWAVAISPMERLARLRALRALALVLLGPEDPLGAALLEAERDPAAAGKALDALDAVPSRRRRRLLASYAELARAARRDQAEPASLSIGTCRGGQALRRGSRA